MVKNLGDMFTRDKIHARDRQTHRQTPHDSTGHTCIASHGKSDGTLNENNRQFCAQSDEK